MKKFLDEACEHIKGLEGPDVKTQNRFFRFPRVRRGSSWIGERSCVRRRPSPEVCSDVQDESGSRLELFFGAVRTCGGWNNPAAMQFRSTYKQLLMRHNIAGGRGNRIPQDDKEMLRNVEDENNGKS